MTVLSILHNIETDVAKFFKGTGTDLEKFGVAFIKVWKKSPSALQSVENFIQELAPMVVLATTVVDPIAEPEVAAALSVIETSVAALQAAATAATTGTSLLTTLQALANSTPAILAAVQVKNPALVASITKIVNFVSGEAKVLIPAVEAWIAQIKAQNAAAVPASIPTPAPAFVSK